MTYFNTTNEHGQELHRYRTNALNQEDRIKRFFMKGGTASPSQVHQRLFADAPVTSVRRAITNLTDKGVLEKTDTKILGPFGRPEYCWRLSR